MAENKMSLFDQLQDLMIQNHFRPEKKLSQFFCINEALLQYLVNRATLKEGDVVLEIGPGTGFLTRIMIDRAKKVGAKVVAVEMDENMYTLLSQLFSSEIAKGELNLILGDALEQDLGELKINKVISLPPYHISSALVSKITLAKGIEKAVLVLDRGFVDKVIAFEGFTEYGSLTALVNLNAKAEVVENNIAPQSFFPPPNCQSAVLQLDFDTKNNSMEYFTFLKELFRHKNKDLQKALRQSIGFLAKSLKWDPKEIESSISKMPFAQKKVYLLAPQELLKVYEYLTSSKDSKKESKKEIKKIKVKKIKSIIIKKEKSEPFVL